MTFHSKRLRLTLPAQEAGYLHWLAVESGYDEPTEAALLLKMGIRLALRRYRRLYGKLPADEADAKTIERNTPGEQGYKGGEGTQLPHFGGVPFVDEETRFEPPLMLPDWAGGHLTNPHREKGFAGHGQEDKE